MRLRIGYVETLPRGCPSWLREGLSSTTPSGRLQAQLLASTAELERARHRLGVRAMVAARVSRDLRSAIEGAPAYFDSHAEPTSPRDLLHHLRAVAQTQPLFPIAKATTA